MPHIYIDESGEIGLSNSRGNFYVVGHVYVNEPKRLQRHLKNYLAKIQVKGHYPFQLQELKFYIPKSKLKKKYKYSEKEVGSFIVNMYHIRKEVLNLIDQYSDGIFATVLDKRSLIQKTWNKERMGNFIIGHTLVTNIIGTLDCKEPPSVLYDAGRLSIRKTIDYHNYLTFKCNQYNISERFGALPTFGEVDSLSEPCIWAADMVAGSYYHHYVNNDDCYSRILQKKIGTGLRKYWDN